MLEVPYVIKGDIELIRRLSNFRDAFKDMSKPLDEIGRKYMRHIQANFIDEGKTFDNPWPPLSPMTIKIKQKLYAEGRSKSVKKPLYRTGALRKSFNYKQSEGRHLVIQSTADYAELHQTGGNVEYKGKMRWIPKRILVTFDEKHVAEIEKIYATWVKRILEKEGKKTTVSAAGGWRTL